MRCARPRNSKQTPDLVAQAHMNLGMAADPCAVTDALFDAAFRSLEAVSVQHPARWAMVVGYWEKMCRLYEGITDTGDTGGMAAGLIQQKRASTPNGKDPDPQPRNQPGLATPEKYRP